MGFISFFLTIKFKNMNKSKFKHAIKNKIPMMWKNMIDKELYKIAGLKNNIFDDKNWYEKPIHILYMKVDKSNTSLIIEDKYVCISEIFLDKENYIKIKRQFIMNKETTRKDESIAPSSNKIINN